MIKMTEIAEQNPWWRQGVDFIRLDPHLSTGQKVFFNRRIIPMDKNNIYLINGPRLSGKTTYLKTMVRNLLQKNTPSQQIYYLNSDYFTSRKELRSALQYFFDTSRDKPAYYILLDEVTSVKGWDIELKGLLDKAVLQNGTLILTLSSMIDLAQLRTFFSGVDFKLNNYHLKPLSFREFIFQAAEQLSNSFQDGILQRGLTGLRAVLPESILDLSRSMDDLDAAASKLMVFRKELDILLRSYMQCGGFPVVINNYLANLAHSQTAGIDQGILEMFIRGLLRGMSQARKQEKVCRHMFKSLIERYGRRYSFTNLAREIEITHVTAIDYLKHLEDSFLGFILYAYDLQKREPKLKGDKKIYFLDPFSYAGVRSYLSSVTDAVREDPQVRQKLLEGVVLAHLLMHAETPGSMTSRGFLWFYYDKTGREMGNIIRPADASWALDLEDPSEPGIKSPKKIAAVPSCIRLTAEKYARTRNRIWIPTCVFLALVAPSAQNL
jgi:predicted AAA+ superfamily ATPase